MMQKIQFNIKTFYFIFLIRFFFFNWSAAAQELKVISSKKEYKKLVNEDSLQKMVEVKTLMPEAVYDLRYATKNNFTGKKLYKQGSKTFVRLAVAEALQKA